MASTGIERESMAAERLAILAAKGAKITGEGYGTTRIDPMQEVASAMSGLCRLQDELIRAKFIEWRGPMPTNLQYIAHQTTINLFAKVVADSEKELTPAGALVVARAAVACVLFPVRCGTCNGTGVTSDQKDCRVCEGNGRKPMSDIRRARAAGVAETTFRRKFAAAADRAEILLRRIEGAALGKVADNLWPRDKCA